MFIGPYLEDITLGNEMSDFHQQSEDFRREKRTEVERHSIVNLVVVDIRENGN